MAVTDGLHGIALRPARDPAAPLLTAVQETHLKMFRASGMFERGTNLKAWRFTISYSAPRNRMRGHVREVARSSSCRESRFARSSGSARPLGPRSAALQ